MKVTPRLPVFMLAAAAVSLAAPCAIAGECSWDDWYEVYVDGRKAGFMNEKLCPSIVGGVDVLVSTQSMKTSFLVGGVQVDASTRVRAVSRPGDQAPIEYEREDVENRVARTYRGKVVSDGVLEQNGEIAGKTVTTAIELPEGAVFSSSLEAIVRPLSGSPFSKKFKVIMEGEGELGDAVVKGIRARPNPDCPGAVAVTVSSVSGVESQEWRDRSGRPLCIEMPAMKTRLVISDRGRAEGRFERFDIYTESLLKPDRPIRGADALKSLTLRFVFDGEPMSFPQDQRQKVISTDKNQVVLRTVLEPPPPDFTGPVKDVPDDVRIYLQPGEFEQADAPEIVAKAREIAWGAGGAPEVAARILKFVSDHLKKPDLGNGYLSALEVLRSGEGDCTEHAVLFTALARAAGIPAREVVGLVYAQGKFAFHQWSEAWLGGWRSYDPSFDEFVINPTHIKIWTGVADQKGLREASLKVGALFKRARIEVLKNP